MTSGGATRGGGSARMRRASGSRPGLRLQARHEYWLVLLLGAVGAGIVFLATRQGWAQIRTAAPRPLPSSTATVTGQALVPAADALALAALASLAAVLATRRMLRRLAGVVLAGFGAGIVAVVSAGISAADVRAAGSGSAAPGSGAGAGAAAGSVTSGAGAGVGGGGGSSVAGFAGHVILTGFAWRGLAIVGAAAVIAVGVLVIWRSARWPVMSSRYEPPARSGPPAEAQVGRVPAGARAGEHGGGGHGGGGGAGHSGTEHGSAVPGGDAATLWESLNRGEDPTARE